MKNLKRYLAVLVAVCVMLTAAVPAFAADALTDAEICKEIGMLQGSGDGLTEAYLAQTPDRMQAAIVYLRLLGLEEEASAFGFEGKDNFADADKTIKSGKSIMAYLYAHPELGWQGGETGNFNPAGKIQAQSYYKVMLEALGYVQGVDFEWTEVFEVAAEAGLTKLADKTNITMNDVAKATVEALKATVNGTEKTLIETLVEAGKIDEEVAIATGLIVPVKELTAEAKITGANKIEVKFNRPVTDKAAASFVLKKGVLSLAVTAKFDDAGTVATVEAANKFTAGTYTLTVNGLGIEANSFDLVAADEVITAIELTGSTLPKSASASFGFKVLNQFGEDMGIAPNGSEISWFYAPNAYVAGAHTDKVAAVDLSDENIKVDGTVTVIAIATNGVQATKSFKVSDQPAIASVDLKAITDNDTTKADRTKVFSKGSGTPTAATIAFEAKDQYGNVIESFDALNGNVQFVYASLNKVVISWKNDASKGVIDVAVPNGISANETITVTALTYGKVFDTFQFTVNAVPAIAETFITAPTKVVASGDTNIDLELSAVDQYGNEVSADDIVTAFNAKIQIFPATTSVTLGAVSATKNDAGKAVIRYADVKGTGNVQFTLLTNAQKAKTVSLSVQPARFAQTIQLVKGLTKLAPNATTDAVSKLEYKLIDQYGVEFTGKVEGSSVEYSIAKVSGDDDGLTITPPSDSLADGFTKEVSVTGVKAKKGTYTLTAKIVKDKATLSTVSTNFIVVDPKTETITYEVAEIPTLYKKGSVDAYYHEVKVIGKDADGKEVAVPNDTIVKVTSSNSGNVAVVGDKVYGVTEETTAIIAVTVKKNSGNTIVTRAATVSKDDLIAKSIVAKKGDDVVTKIENAGDLTIDNLFTNANLKFVVTDQFDGTSLSSLASVQVVIAKPDATTEVLATNNYTFNVKGTYVVTAITNNGLVLQIEVVIDK